MLPRWQIILPLTLLPSAAANAVDPDAGRALYAPCVACHGANAEGNAALNSPALAGQSAAYLARQLQHFKSGVRGSAEGDTWGAQMVPMAATLVDDAAVDNMAAYLASLPAVKPAATIEGDAHNGNKQYQSKCGACHGANGKGNDALNSPKLTGIGDAYMLRQVRAFQKGYRGTHPDDKFGKQMKMMSTLVSDKELNDLAAYLNERTKAQ